MNIQVRSEGEVTEAIDRLCLNSWGAAQSGSSSDPAYSQLSMLFWCLGLEMMSYGEIASRGEKVYKDGWRFEWNRSAGAYMKVRRSALKLW